METTFWTDILAFLRDAGLRLAGAAAIAVGAFVAAWLLRILIRRVVNRVVNGAKTKANVVDTQALDRSPLATVRVVQRTRTLGSILQNIVNVAVGIVAIVMIVQVLAPDALGSFALITAALGAGLGFGAQNIVKDVLNGIFIVAEDQVGIGDVVDLGLATGIVEYVSVRITHVRDVNGSLWYVRNGEITRIGNMSQGWSRVIVDLAVPADTNVDVEAIENTMLDAAQSLAHDPKWRSRILENPEVWGLESVGEDVLIIRIVMKARPAAKDDVARELRMRLKTAVTASGVAVPQLHSVTLTGPEGAQRVRGANPPRTRPTPVAEERPTWKPKRAPRKPKGATGGGTTDQPSSGGDAQTPGGTGKGPRTPRAEKHDGDDE